MLGQPGAPLVGGDGLVEGHGAALQPLDDLVELGERPLVAQTLDVVPGGSHPGGLAAVAFHPLSRVSCPVSYMRSPWSVEPVDSTVLMTRP